MKYCIYVKVCVCLCMYILWIIIEVCMHEVRMHVYAHA